MPSQFQGFKFKQFTVEHRHCAMKVGTDSILLGSWTQPKQSKRILDIGTGSGLLALMMAQKSDAKSQIVGIDIDSDAIVQARLNAAASPWTKRIHFEHSTLQNYQVDTNFDLIISNPPYFPAKQGRLFASDANYMSVTRQQARHTSELSISELFYHAARLLAPDGCLYCILPCEHTLFAEKTQRASDYPLTYTELASEYGLSCNQHTWVSSQPGKAPIRSLLAFSKHKSELLTQAIDIRDDQGEYSSAYRTICKDFYLNF